MKSFALLLAVGVFLISYESVFAVGFTQSFAVQGRLLCRGTPSQGTKIKLHDKGVVWDTELDEVKTNSNGEFELAGTTSEITAIDPKINIFHNCDWSGPCERKYTIELPKAYITQGEAPYKAAHNTGTINLENKFPNEIKDCNN